MWRSFFLAVGIGLMLLGAEALVFERVVINESAKLPKFLNGLFEKDHLDSFENSNYLLGQGNPALRNSAETHLQRVPYSSASRFGPSRFSGPRSGNYGGGRIDLSRSGLNSNGSQTPNAFPVSFPNAVNSAGSGRAVGSRQRIGGPRTILTKDWMPWSLLAAGAIIFLYTSSHGRSRND